MRGLRANARAIDTAGCRRRGAVLIVVLWVAFGLVSLTLYFSQTMAFEFKASDAQTAGMEAEMIVAGAARYVSNLLAQSESPGSLLLPEGYLADMIPVGSGVFWLVGRGDARLAEDQPAFGLVDEASKLNLNTATLEMLEALPFMTPEVAAAIIDWRDEDEEATNGGAENETYMRLSPPYQCKNAPFESVDELRLVYGVTLDLLFGEDLNWNGILDPNEDDGELSPPMDNQDGRLDSGLLNYVTVYSREPNTRADGSERIVLQEAAGGNNDALGDLLQETFGESRRDEIMARFGNGAGLGSVRSVLEFYVRSGMSAEEFQQIEGEITAQEGDAIEGLVNVNTASAEVLACLPGLNEDLAYNIVSYRQSAGASTNSAAWLTEVLDEQNLAAAGTNLTGRAYQFTADISAVGRHGRGYRRTQFVFDTASGTPRLLARRDLEHMGWAPGREARERLDQALAQLLP